MLALISVERDERVVEKAQQSDLVTIDAAEHCRQRIRRPRMLLQALCASDEMTSTARPATVER